MEKKAANRGTLSTFLKMGISGNEAPCRNAYKDIEPYFFKDLQHVVPGIDNPVL
jgi:hypothetical protein